MFGVRDAISAIRRVMVIEERVGRLAQHVTQFARQVNAELSEIHREQRELSDGVARIEGAFAVLDRLQISPDKR